jgi:hypothetical protein
VPDSKLTDQLRLVEAVTLTLGREVGEPVQRQPGIRALARLPVDRLDSAPRCRLRCGHAGRRQRLHRHQKTVRQRYLVGFGPLGEIDHGRTSTELVASLRRTLCIIRRPFRRDRWSAMPTPSRDETLIKALVRAHRCGGVSRAVRRSRSPTLRSRRGITDAYVCRLLPLTCVAPDIVEAILDGRQPKGLTLTEMFGSLPFAWNQQQVHWSPGCSDAGRRCLKVGRFLNGGNAADLCQRRVLIAYAHVQVRIAHQDRRPPVPAHLHDLGRIRDQTLP